MTCASCDTTGTVRTRHLSMVRASTFVFTHTSRDDLCRARDLTNAIAYMAIRCDLKCPDASVRLCSVVSPVPDGWRVGIVIEDQTQRRGQLTITLIPGDTAELAAMGHDDPWIYDLLIKMPDGSIVREIAQSNLDLYPQTTDVPVP